MYLRGFDRRGCAASLNNASASGFTVSGVFSDQADFAVLVLFDADDQFGHLFTTKYLPDFSLAGVTLDFDLAITNAQNPVSRKFQSVPWGALSYITKSETPGTVSLQPMATSATGMAAASQTFTVNGTPALYDRVRARLSEQHRLRLPGLDRALGGAFDGDVRVLQLPRHRLQPHHHHRVQHVLARPAFDRRLRRHRHRAGGRDQRGQRSERDCFRERQQRDPHGADQQRREHQLLGVRRQRPRHALRVARRSARSSPRNWPSQINGTNWA